MQLKVLGGPDKEKSDKLMLSPDIMMMMAAGPSVRRMMLVL